MPVKSAILALVILFSACTPVEENPGEVYEASNGKVTLRTVYAAEQLRSCDLLEISYHLTFPAGYTVKTPGDEDNYGDFSIYQIHSESPVARNEYENTLMAVYILEPGLPKTHKLPPLTFKLWDEKGEQKEIRSREKLIVVSSTIPSDHSGELEDIIISQKEASAWIIPAAAGGLLLVLSACFLLRRKETTVEEAKASQLHLHELKSLHMPDQISKLYGSTCRYLKEKFDLQYSASDFNSLKPELEKKVNADLFEQLSKSFHSLEKLLYSGKEKGEQEIKQLHSEFVALLSSLEKSS